MSVNYSLRNDQLNNELPLTDLVQSFFFDWSFFSSIILKLCFTRLKRLWRLVQQHSRVLLNPPTTDDLLTDIPTNQPTAPTTTDPLTRICLKNSKIWRHSFYRMQTQLEKWKTTLRPIIYLNRIKVFDRMDNIYLYNFEHLFAKGKDQLIVYF